MNKNFEETREIVKDILERRKTNIKPGIIEDFVKIVSSIRYINSVNRQQLSIIWGGIRINTELTDFIIDSTREFLIRCFSDKGEDKYLYEDLCNELTRSYQLLINPASAMDAEIVTSVFTNQIGELLLGNPWFTLLLISDSIIATEEKDG